MYKGENMEVFIILVVLTTLMFISVPVTYLVLILIDYRNIKRDKRLHRVKYTSYIDEVSN